ncbi:hypothetical protein BMS3Abin04_02483 [bacterium BMS3Abin04]|nr:hypothetical protein BMS3Abin04_02483 [bacterium BMS3Abin04]
MNQKLENEIISAAYGDVNILQKIRIKRLAKRNEEVHRLLTEYSKTAQKISDIKTEFPEEIIKKAKNKIKVQPGNEKGFLLDFYSVIFAKPLVSFSAVVLLVGAIIVSSMIYKSGQSRIIYSRQQIALADRQAKQTLALVGKIFNNTTQTLEKQVFVRRIGEPFQKSFNAVNELLTGGNKNGKLN